MNILKKTLLSSFIIILFSFGCKEKFAKDTTKLEQADLILKNDSVFYKGKLLEFDEEYEKWDKQIEKSRVLSYEGSEASNYVYDNIGYSIATVPYDDSQKWSKTKVRNFYIYYRNLDSQLGRIGELSFASGKYYHNIKPEDWLDEGQKELTEDQKIRIKNLNDGSDKKSDFVFPYKTHKKPIFIEGAMIDSTMTVADINKRRVAKGLEPFHYSPMVGGVNSMGRANEDTSGKYTGIYKTEFGPKTRYELTLENIKNQVIYIKIRKFSPDEIQNYLENLKQF